MTTSKQTSLQANTSITVAGIQATLLNTMAKRLVGIAAAATVVTSLSSCGDFVPAGGEQENYSHYIEASGVQDILPDYRPQGIDDELRPYVELFESYYGATINDLPVNFADTGKATGICRINYDGRREVRINKAIWDEKKGQDDWMIPTVFHELGHCVLGRDHRKTEMTFGGGGNMQGQTVPASIMYPTRRYIPYSAQKQHYLDELFQ